jgi:hypothetical protein
MERSAFACLLASVFVFVPALGGCAMSADSPAPGGEETTGETSEASCSWGLASSSGNGDGNYATWVGIYRCGNRGYVQGCNSFWAGGTAPLNWVTESYVNGAYQGEVSGHQSVPAWAQWYCVNGPTYALAGGTRFSGVVEGRDWKGDPIPASFTEIIF